MVMKFLTLAFLYTTGLSLYGQAPRPDLTSRAEQNARVVTDSTLTGKGTKASPLGVKLPLPPEAFPERPSTPAPPVVTDGVTLTGDGTAASPLAIRVPLSLGNNVPTGQPVLTVNGGSGVAIQSHGSMNANPCCDGQDGIFATQTGLNGAAVFGLATGANGLAGEFEGNVEVTGNVSKAGGSFRIDDPLDPANKYLSHSFVESPDMMDIYNGIVTTDQSGTAIVTMPAYFTALNRDFRYQLTVIGQFAQAIVQSEIAANQFTIRTDKPAVKVSWQVTGIRQDAWANAHRIPIEEYKPANEQGYYLHPELQNAGPEKSVMWARYAQKMQELKDRGVLGR